MKVKLLEDIEGIGESGDYVSMTPEDVEKYDGKVEARRETGKSGKFI